MLVLQDAATRQYGAERGSTPLHRDAFERISLWVVRSAGGREGFYFALMLILAWVGVGPYFRFQEVWTTAFSIVTTSVTFPLVFFIQHVQNRESKAVHLKLDELIYAAKNARNELISIEYLTEEQLDELGRRYARLAGHYQNTLRQSAGSGRASRERPASANDSFPQRRRKESSSKPETSPLRRPSRSSTGTRPYRWPWQLP